MISETKNIFSYLNEVWMLAGHIIHESPPMITAKKIQCVDLPKCETSFFSSLSMTQFFWIKQVNRPFAAPYIVLHKVVKKNKQLLKRHVLYKWDNEDALHLE